MPDLATLGVFAAAALTLLVVPGPAVLYIVTRSLEQGRRAGVAAVLGVHTGSLVHVGAAAAGLSALLMTSATAFTVVKAVGAAYLVWLGLTRLLRRNSTGTADAPRVASLRRAYVEGVVVNILNPKTALFFFAFLPQFVDIRAGAVPLQITVLGMLFIALGVVTDGTYAVAAGAIRRRVRRPTGRWGGLVYVGLGVTTALAKRP